MLRIGTCNVKSMTDKSREIADVIQRIYILCEQETVKGELSKGNRGRIQAAVSRNRHLEEKGRNYNQQ